jgi:hypothetical protein
MYGMVESARINAAAHRPCIDGKSALHVYVKT